MAKRHALTLVRGKSLPLTAPQQELIRIFAEHLRRLPTYQPGSESAGWDSAAYEILNKLLTRHFREEYPTWTERKNSRGGYNRHIDDLPGDAGEHFSFLIKNAACPADARMERRSALLELARSKKWVFEFAERYERNREKLGLPRENLIQKLTPLERAAQASFEENHAG